MARIEQTTRDLEAAGTSVDAQDIPSGVAGQLDRCFRPNYFKAYAAWIGIIALIYTAEKDKQLIRTDGLFLKMSPTALLISYLVFEILSKAKPEYLKIYPNLVKILKSFAWFSGTLAHVLLFIVIVIRSNHNWGKYLIISGNFVVIFGFNFFNDMIVLGKKMCVYIKNIFEAGAAMVASCLNSHADGNSIPL